MLNRSLELPLLAAQNEIFLAHKIDPDNCNYNIGQYIEISGAIDAALFEAAVQHVLKEAESLCVHFSDDLHSPRQILNGPPRWSMPYFDVSNESDPLGSAQVWMKADLAHTISLTHDRLFNFVLFKIGSERFLWYQRYHHLINDGYGAWLIAQRVAEVYSANVNNLPDSGASFGYLRLLLEREDRYRASEDFTRDRKYWLECLAEMSEPVSLNDDPPIISGGTLRLTTYLESLSADRLRMVAQSAGATLPQVITAMAAAYLSRMKGANEVIL